MLTESEFNTLYYLKKNGSHPVTQREMAEALRISLGKINKLIRGLSEDGLLASEEDIYRVTERGNSALQPHRVDNAVIMAAGMSTRFAPLSYEKPKGLLVVKGEILIEREIRQLQKAGITDITVVVGYMKEKFFYLEEKFGVKIVVNEDYYKYNNTSTLVRVLDRLANTYICSSDNYFTENVFEPYVYRAYYAAVYAAGKTEEYCLSTSPDGRIKKVSIGGENAWYMLGHVYFDRAFSDVFKEILIREYESPLTRDQLWENLYMRYTDRLKLYIRKYDTDVIKEFDSLEELRLFDEEYINNADSQILRNICGVLRCDVCDIKDIQAIKAGLTNTSFRFEVKGGLYVYRHPSVGSEQYINRNQEKFALEIAEKLGLDDTCLYMDAENGWKLSRYIKNVRELNPQNTEEVDRAFAMMRKLHEAQHDHNNTPDVWERTLWFIQKLKENSRAEYEGFKEMNELLWKVKKIADKTGDGKKCLCHNDCCHMNFLLDENGHMVLVDWEYAGTDDPASDLGSFLCCADYDDAQTVCLIERYLQHTPGRAELRHFLAYVALASYHWYNWALYQEIRGNAVGVSLYQWHKRAKLYAEKVFEMI